VSQENVDLLRGMFAAWDRADVDAYVASFHPDAEFVSDVVGRVEGGANIYHGRASLRRYWEEHRATFDLSFDISAYRDLGDTVIAFGHVTASGRSSGVSVESPIAYVAEFDGGLIRTFRTYLDRGEALSTVGLEE
jgi:ketosteroid isomerase-like protein